MEHCPPKAIRVLFLRNAPRLRCSVVPAAPDFAVTMALDRYEAPAGGGTAIALAAITRLNGYAGPIELSVVGDETGEEEGVEEESGDWHGDDGGGESFESSTRCRRGPASTT